MGISRVDENWAEQRGELISSKIEILTTWQYFGRFLPHFHTTCTETPTTFWLSFNDGEALFSYRSAL